MSIIYKSDEDLHSDAENFYNKNKENYHQDSSNIDSRIANKSLVNAIVENTNALYAINDTLKKLVELINKSGTH